MSKENQLSRRERQIMDILHTRSQATAAEVHEVLADPPSYSAIRAFLRILEDKGHIAHKQDGLRYIYFPLESKKEASRSALQRVLKTFFGGSVDQAVAALLEVSDAPLSSAEMNKIQDLINKARKEGK